MAKEKISPAGGPARGHHRRRLLGLSYSIRFDSQPRERDRIYAFSQTHFDPQLQASRRYASSSIQELHLPERHDAGLRGDAAAPGLQLHQPHSTKSCGCARASRRNEQRRTRTYFEIFSLPAKLVIDLPALEESFYALSRKLHPDRFAANPSASSRRAGRKLATQRRLSHTERPHRPDRISAEAGGR